MRIGITGITGKLGSCVASFIEAEEDLYLIGGYNQSTTNSYYPIYSCLDTLFKDCDVIVDVTAPTFTKRLLTCAASHQKPLIIATTGWTEGEDKQIEALSEIFPIFQSVNFSLGIALFSHLIESIPPFFWEECDPFLIESHHKNKSDTPSGTATYLTSKASTNIPISSLRIGNVSGQHSLELHRLEETFTLKHKTLSRNVYARGIMEAIYFLADKKSGRFDMQSLIASKTKKSALTI